MAKKLLRSGRVTHAPGIDKGRRNYEWHGRRHRIDRSARINPEDLHMHVRTLTATAIAVVLMGSSAAPAAIRVSTSRSASAQNPKSATAALPSRPNKVDWNKIKTAARLRNMALAPHRTARFRSFAAMLGLGQLSSIHPLAPGRCRTAVIDLHNNLLDLEEAFPGENWGPLRRAVAKEPSIHACAPRPKHARRYGYIVFAQRADGIRSA
jgi:hypothetical protein